MCVICLDDGASPFGLRQKRRVSRFVAEAVELGSIATCMAALAYQATPMEMPAPALGDEDIARLYGARRLAAIDPNSVSESPAPEKANALIRFPPPKT